MVVHYILLGLSFKTRALWKLSCLLKAAPQSLACIRLGLQGQSFLHAPSTGCGPDVCIALCLLSGLLALTLPPEETRDCWPLPPEETAASYLLSRHYSLVIASGPEVTFVTPATPVNRSNME
ncbi:hypothetical protein Tco_1294122 [Tanacetum coccineum]